MDKPEWFQRTVYGQARQLSLTTTGKEFPKTLSFKFGDYLDNRQMEIFQCLQVYIMCSFTCLVKEHKLILYIVIT